MRYLLYALFLGSSLEAVIDAKVDRNPVHEAFIERMRPLLPIETLDKRPPPRNIEKTPEKSQPGMIWIHGYWAWDREKEDYTWVCGVFRAPPPEQVWVPGYWKETEQGWYWVSGLWHDLTLNPIAVMELPPENPEESVTSPKEGAFFWASGYWEYNPYERNFRWLKGSWLPYDKNWVFVPAKWQWRPEGYVFQPPYWDYPLEKRGIAYDCDSKQSYVPISDQVLISRIYYYYPDYSPVLLHHLQFNPNFWSGCWCLPPWWKWSDWSALNTQNQWRLWWWWSHPGFAAPEWVDASVAAKIAPPDEKLVALFKGGKLPFFLTPKGLPSQEEWLKAIISLTDIMQPLLPVKLWQEGMDAAGASLNKGDLYLRPTGAWDSSSAVQKPHINSSLVPYGKAFIPQIPKSHETTLPPPPDIVEPHPAPKPKFERDIWGQPIPLKKDLSPKAKPITWIETVTK